MNLKPRYRIVTDSYAGFEVQIRPWWYPFYTQCSEKEHCVNTHLTIESATEFIKEHAKGREYTVAPNTLTLIEKLMMATRASYTEAWLDMLGRRIKQLKRLRLFGSGLNMACAALNFYNFSVKDGWSAWLAFSLAAFNFGVSVYLWYSMTKTINKAVVDLSILRLSGTLINEKES